MNDHEHDVNYSKLLVQLQLSAFETYTACLRYDIGTLINTCQRTWNQASTATAIRTTTTTTIAIPIAVTDESCDAVS
jgi:hypothetical protein